MNSVKYVGMDVHKGITVIVVLNAAGHVESRTQVKTKAETFRDFFRGLSGRVEVVFEEGAHSAWLYQLLKPLVAEARVCDPRHNKLIGDVNKSDDAAAETLARLLRMRELKAVYKGGCDAKAHGADRITGRGRVSKKSWAIKATPPLYSPADDLKLQSASSHR